MSALCYNISLVPCNLNTQMVCHDIKALLRQSFLLAALDYVATQSFCVVIEFSAFSFVLCRDISFECRDIN